MRGIYVEVEGEQRLIGRLDEFNHRIVYNVNKVIDDTANDVLMKSVERVPVSSGRLVASIDKRQIPTDTAIVGAGVKARARHGAFMEFGSGPRGMSENMQEQPSWHHYKSSIRFPRVSKLRQWCIQHGLSWRLAYAIAKTIQRKGGLSPRPFLYPSFESEKPRFINEIKSAIEGAIPRE